MRVFDTRKGDEIKVGDSIIYPPYMGEPDPDDYTLLEVEEHLLSATAVIRSRGRGVVRVPLTVRFTHPSFFLQKVAFLPT